MRIICLFIMCVLAGCQSPEPVGTALFVGDSITRNWDTSRVLVSATNTGLPGAGSHQIHDQALPTMQRTHPDMVHILAGTNNNLADEKMRTAGKVLAIGFAARAAGATTIVIGTLPPSDPAKFPMKQEDVEDYNTLLKVLGVVCGFTVADYHAAMIRPNGSVRDEFFIDGLHPNEAGYAAMGSVLRDSLDMAPIAQP